MNSFIFNFLSFIVTDYDVDGGLDLDIFDINEGMQKDALCFPMCRKL